MGNVATTTSLVLVGLVMVATSILYAFDISLLSLTGQPDCEFTKDSPTCEYEVSLPEGKQAQSYTLELTGKGRPGPFTEPKTINPIDTYTDYEFDEGYEADEREELKYWLFKPSRNLNDVEQVIINGRVDVSGSVQGWSDYEDDIDEHEAYFSVDGYKHTLPYEESSARACRNEDDEDCPGGDPDNTGRYTHWSRWGHDGDDHHVSPKFIGGEKDVETQPSSFDVESDEDIRGDQSGSETFNITLQSPKPFVQDQLFQVAVGARREPVDEAEASIGSGRDWTVQYQELSYPSDITVGDTTVQGEIINETGLDVTEQVNDACNRDVSNDACEATVTLASDTIGDLYISEETTTQDNTPLVYSFIAVIATLFLGGTTWLYLRR